MRHLRWLCKAILAEALWWRTAADNPIFPLGVTRLVRDWPGSDTASATTVLTQRRDDDLRFLREAELKLKLKAILQDPELPVEKAASRLLVWLSHSTLHPALYQAELRASADTLGRRPGIVDRVKGYGGGGRPAPST